MSIQEYAAKAGYPDLNQLGTRTVWTCGAFILGSAVGSLIFPNFDVKTHMFFGVVQGAALNLLFHNEHIGEIEVKLSELDPERKETMEKVGRIFQFVIICMVPLFLAKNLTTWFFEEVSLSHMLKVGVAYNGLVGGATAYGYAQGNFDDADLGWEIV